MLENRDASLAAEAPCSIPPSQIIPPRSWSLLEGALLSVGYPLGKGMNCLRGWLSPRDRAIALVSCLVITHASPKQTINLQLPSIRDAESNMLLLACLWHWSQKQVQGMLTGIPRLLLLPDPNPCRCLMQQELVSDEQERSEQIVSFFFFLLD